MCYSHPLYPPSDNQHAASEAIRRRDSSTRSVPPPTTSLRPPGYQQSTHPGSETSSSSSTTRQHSEARRLRIDVPAYVAVGLMGGTAYLIVRARHRTAARLATLQSARDKAVGQTLGWKHAYLARERLPAATGSGFHGRRQNFEPRRSHRDWHTQPRNPPGGFIDPRTAEAARREERQALDGPPLFENLADTARRFWGLATGRSLEPSESTGERHDKSKSEVQSGTAKGWQWSWGTGTCQPQASRQASTPAERWRRAFGAGATNSQTDHSGWEAIVRQKTLEKAMEAARSSTPTSAPLSSLNEAKDAGDVQPTRKKMDTSKQASQRKILVDDAFHDELDSNFLRRHIDKTKASTISPSVPSAVPRQESKSKRDPESGTGKGQHFSMDNLFLEYQLEDAAIEGREARERMQKKLEASKRSSIGGTASKEAGAVEHGEEDLREARLADPTLYGNDQDAIVDELASELFNSSPSALHSTREPLQSRSPPQAAAVAEEEEGAPAAPTTSLWEAALEYAEEEGAAVRRRREMEHRHRQERLERTNSGMGASMSSDATPRRMVLEPEDLDEALVLHELAQGQGQGKGQGSEHEDVSTGERSHVEGANPSFLVPEEQLSSSSSTSSPSPSPSPSSSRLAALEARVDLANAELRLVRSQMARLQRRLASALEERS
ncbi:hypothetical protein BCV69DRAFT_281261, partial [Microstroma glucosiphilum]